MDLGRLSPASEVAGGHTTPFKNWQRPELDGQDPFQICGGLCQTRKTPTLAGRSEFEDGLWSGDFLSGYS
jgi:hypothetical protein